MVVQHNLASMNSNRMFGITNNKLSKTAEKLSSGYKINRAADDAAGLAISEKMRRQIRGLSQASKNAQDGISLVQIADGAMNEVDEMLHRGTELSIKAANGTLSDDDRAYLQEEIQHIKNEIDQIKEKTTFNEIKVLKGADVEVDVTSGGAAVLGGFPAWVGIEGSVEGDGFMSSTYITHEPFTYVVDADSSTGSGVFDVPHSAAVLDFSSYDGSPAKLAELTAENTGFYSTCCSCTNHYSIQFVDGGGNSTESSPPHYIFKVDISGAANGHDVVEAVKNAVGGNPNSHYTKIITDGNKLIVYDNRSKVNATNAAKAQEGLDALDTITWTSWSGLGSNQTASASSHYGIFGRGIAVSLDDIPSDQPVDIILQIGSEEGHTMEIALPSISSRAIHIDGVNISTISGAQNAITSFKNAIAYVSGERSRMGAYQNRLEHTIKNLDNVVENTTRAESQIRDTDMATTMVDYTNTQILAQAGTAMLTQANQANQTVLSLLS